MLTNRSMPEQVLISVLGYPDVGAAVERLCESFDPTERRRAGDHRKQLAGRVRLFSQSVADRALEDRGGVSAARRRN